MPLAGDDSVYIKSHIGDWIVIAYWKKLNFSTSGLCRSGSRKASFIIEYPVFFDLPRVSDGLSAARKRSEKKTNEM